MSRYTYQPYAYETPPELIGKPASLRQVAIVGAGPVGLALAIDLALHDISSVVLDDNNVVSVGSRAICWSKRTLEIFDRLGVGKRMVDKGVTWKVGRVFHGDREIWSFDLLPEPGHKMPAFINLQQYYVEEYLVDRARDFPDLIDLRWKNKVVGIGQDDDGVTLQIETPDGDYSVAADYAIACDGARSAIRAMLGLDFAGRAFEERFLITDVEMKADFPSERWFWFEPTFHHGQSALLHKQPDDIYRIDLQLGPDADPDEEKKPENVIPRIERVVDGRPFEIDWVSVYTFQCRRLDRFVHDRIIFAGDSAHIVSPFGARGGNGGIQDIDNLAWKLAAILEGKAGADLLETYNIERIAGADENLLNSSRSTCFMTPKSSVERDFRDAVLTLAERHDFARRLVNSGRLSLPCHYRDTPLAGHDGFTAGDLDHLAPGAPAIDAPLTGGGYLLDRIGGAPVLVVFNADPAALAGLPVAILVETSPEAVSRYAGTGGGACYLFRPDQHVAARWRPEALDAARVRAELSRMNMRG